ncbi:DUF4190 domain-containing protein [Streptomyces formicae]|uniref:DUF4190 domain-containing protein n=1 Tax=Streptomyces formicae TaxID=1616117 RepID=A0ABY3WG79_9ACTN|nr:DUF4190 domain-containing protein [Streptomyces formicae]UNM11582.1 DUF4190 domain-containing protein [Streptomyces formicae]
MADQSDQRPDGHEPGDPWAPPERRASRPEAPEDRVELGKATPDAQQGRPTVHDQPTMTSMPSAGTGGAAPQGVDPGAVPPPPTAPGGPAQPAPGPYGYPAATGAPGYGYPAAAGTVGAGAPGYGYPGYPGYPGSSWTMGPAPQNGMGTAAMVLGILALCLSWCYGIFGLILGTLALIFGILGRKRYQRGEADNKGQALAGIILGSIGIVVAGLFIALYVWIFANADEWEDEGVDDPWATTLVVGAAPR